MSRDHDLCYLVSHHQAGKARQRQRPGKTSQGGEYQEIKNKGRATQ